MPFLLGGAKKTTEPKRAMLLLLLKRSRPLINRVIVRHREITSTTEGHEVVDPGRSALGLRYIMPRVKIKHSDDILAPPDKALSLKDGTRLLNPDLFSEGLGNRRLLAHCMHIVRQG